MKDSLKNHKCKKTNVSEVLHSIQPWTRKFLNFKAGVLIFEARLAAKEIDVSDWAACQNIANDLSKFWGNYHKTLGIKHNLRKNEAFSFFINRDMNTAQEFRDYLEQISDPASFYELIAATQLSHQLSGRAPLRSYFEKIQRSFIQSEQIRMILFFYGKCCYCKINLRKANYGENVYTVDHIQPVNTLADFYYGLLGRSQPGNLVPCCERCNVRKGGDSAELWLLKDTMFSWKEKVEILALIMRYSELTGYVDYTELEERVIKIEFNNLRTRIDKIKKSFKGNSLKALNREINNAVKDSVELINQLLEEGVTKKSLKIVFNSKRQNIAEIEFEGNPDDKIENEESFNFALESLKKNFNTEK